jgi:hypothetical protein
VQHSVADLQWGVLRGARGPSDGSVGPRANVPSALAVLRHAPLYLAIPSEIDDAFGVLENHVMAGERLYPVAIPVVPFLFDVIRRGSPIAERITQLLARYATRMGSLDPGQRDTLRTIIADHAPMIAGWLGRYDRAASALAIHIPEVREAFAKAVEGATRLAPVVLLALVELDLAPGDSIAIATGVLDSAESHEHERMCAAAFLARHGDRSPALQTRVDAALPPAAQEVFNRVVAWLWIPTIVRPVVAPRLHLAEVVHVGEQFVLVRAGARSVTLPWQGAPTRPGDHIQVGLTAHGQPKLALVTDAEGRVIVIDF